MNITSLCRKRSYQWPSRNLVVATVATGAQRIETRVHSSPTADIMQPDLHLLRQLKTRTGNKARICRSGTYKLHDRRHHHQHSKTELHHRRNRLRTAHLRTLRNSPRLVPPTDKRKGVIINNHSLVSLREQELNTSNNHRAVSR